MRKWLFAEIVIGFFLATIFWSGVLGWQAAYAPTEQQKQACYDEAEKKGHKSEECKSLWEKATSDPVAFFTLWLVIFTAVLSASTIGLYYAGEKQADLTRQSLIADQRAWISVIPKVVDDIEFGDGNASISLELLVTNTGKTSAVRAHTNLKVTTTPWIDPVFIDEVRDFCAFNKKRDVMSGRLVSSNETYVRPWFPTVTDVKLRDLNGYGDMFSATIIVCTTYEALQSDEINQTAVVYGVGCWVSPEIIAKGGRVGRSNITLQAGPGGFAT